MKVSSCLSAQVNGSNALFENSILVFFLRKIRTWPSTSYVRLQCKHRRFGDDVDVKRQEKQFIAIETFIDAIRCYCKQWLVFSSVTAVQQRNYEKRAHHFLPHHDFENGAISSLFQFRSNPNLTKHLSTIGDGETDRTNCQQKHGIIFFAS